MDRRNWSIPGPPHDDRHLVHRTLARQAPVREHHHAGMQWWRSPSWTDASTKKLWAHYANCHKSSTRTRTTEFLYSEEWESTAKTIRWSIASRPGMAEPKLENLLVANFLFIIFTIMVATRTPRHSMARSKFVEEWWLQTLSKPRRNLFHRFRVETYSECRACDGEWRRNTSSNAHFSQCCQCRAGSVLSLCAHPKSSTHSMFRRPLLDVPDPCPSFCSTPPRSTSTALPMTGIRRPLGYSTRRIAAWPSGWLNSSHEPKTCIDASSEHTPSNYTLRRCSFSVEHNDLTTLRKPRWFSAASGSQRQPASSIIKCGADLWSSTRTLVRGNEWISSVEGTLSKGKIRSRSGKCANSVRKEKSLCVLWTESWMACWRRIRSSEKIIWGWGRIGHEKLRTKIWYLPSMRPIEKSNLRDWSCIRQING